MKKRKLTKEERDRRRAAKLMREMIEDGTIMVIGEDGKLLE
jgi:hypothetical protein